MKFSRRGLFGFFLGAGAGILTGGLPAKTTQPLSRRRRHIVVRAESDWEVAKVKWFNNVRGFGFLTRGDDTPMIFLHRETVEQFGFSELRRGQLVQVRWGRGSKGLMAAELRAA